MERRTDTHREVDEASVEDPPQDRKTSERTGAEKTGIRPGDATPEPDVDPPQREDPDPDHVVEQKQREN